MIQFFILRGDALIERPPKIVFVEAHDLTSRERQAALLQCHQWISTLKRNGVLSGEELVLMAERIFEQFEFPTSIVDAAGWSVICPNVDQELERIVFIENPDKSSVSVAVTFRVWVEEELVYAECGERTEKWTIPQARMKFFNEHAMECPRMKIELELSNGHGDLEI